MQKAMLGLDQPVKSLTVPQGTLAVRTDQLLQLARLW